MTKAQYIDFIRNSLQMVDKTARFHGAQVEAAINLAVNTVFYDLYKSLKKPNIKSLERYSSFVTTAPAININRTGRYYSDLTVDMVDLPRNGSGIVNIEVQPPTTTKFVPIGALEMNQLYGSESSLPGNVIGFTPVGTRIIEYWNYPGALAIIIRLIKQFKSYSSTDNVLLPYGQDERIIELVRQYLGVIPPKDLVNDNSDVTING